MKEDSSFSVFVFLWLHPLWMGHPRGREVASRSRLDEEARVAASWARATLSLGRTAGSASWMLRHGPPRHALLLQEFYEEEREKRNSWGRDSWRTSLFRSVAEGKLERWRERAGWRKRTEMMMEGGGGGGQALAAAGRDDGGHCSSILVLLLLNFIFTAC